MNLYRKILSGALKATWKNKYLWFFGLFATLLGGTGELELLFSSTEGSYQNTLLPNFSSWIDAGIFSGAAMKNAGDLAIHDPFSFFILISLLLVVLLLGLFLIWLTVTSQAGLVYNSAKIKLDKKHSLKDGLNAGMDKFWSVFGLNLSLKFVISLLFFLITIPIVNESAGGNMGGKVFFFLFLLFIPLSIIVSFIVKYAIAFVVIREQCFLKALKDSWNLFKSNWLVSIEMAFILFFISFASWVLLILLFLVLAVPIVFIVLVFSQVLVYVNYMVLIISAVFVYIVIIITYGSFLASFQISAWTYLFIELIGKGGKSKINRLFNK